MSESNGRDAVFDQAVHAAFEADELVDSDGLRDMTKLRERIFAVLARHKVLSRGERTEKAVRRSDLVSAAAPSLPGPEAWASEPDPDLARRVYLEVWKLVWQECRTAADSPMQRMVGMNMGNGYVLCKTKVTKDQIEAAYITDDRACIQEDFIRPDNMRAERTLMRLTANREMLVIRQPHNAPRYVREYGRTMRQVLDAQLAQLQLTMESVVSAPRDDDEDGDE